jgi:hypothetical protein
MRIFQVCGRCHQALAGPKFLFDPQRGGFNAAGCGDVHFYSKTSHLDGQRLCLWESTIEYRDAPARGMKTADGRGTNAAGTAGDNGNRRFGCAFAHQPMTCGWWAVSTPSSQ